LERAYPERVCRQNLGAVAQAVPELCNFENVFPEKQPKNGTSKWRKAVVKYAVSREKIFKIAQLRNH